jgi:hypothetical protein
LVKAGSRIIGRIDDEGGMVTIFFPTDTYEFLILYSSLQTSESELFNAKYGL